MANTKKAKVVFVEKTTACLFCKRSTEDEVDFGGLKKTKNLHAHYYCLLLSETIGQSGRDNEGILGFLPKDILGELCKSSQKQCYYCKEYGATLGCGHKNCKRKFHLPCGLMKDTQHNFNIYTSYCHLHRKSSNVPTHIKKSISSYQCMICLEDFNSNTKVSQVVWADCCKSDVLLHIRCMKQMALSAGYFTKCPGCNNQKQFTNTIKSYGVFVPERDASWELGENAFSELLYVHQHCDVRKCLCPQGRTYSTKRGKWLIRLCSLCGSYGAHHHCARSRKNITCDACNFKKGESLANTSFDGAFQSVDSGIVASQETSKPSCSNSAGVSPRTSWSNDSAVAISKERSNASCSNSGSIFFEAHSPSRFYSTFDSCEEHLTTDYYSINNDCGSNELENYNKEAVIDLCSDEEEEVHINDSRGAGYLSEKDRDLLQRLSSSVKVTSVTTGKVISVSEKPLTSTVKLESHVTPKRVARKSTSCGVVADKSTSKKISRRVAMKSTTHRSRKRALGEQDKQLPSAKRSRSERSTQEYTIAGNEHENWAPAESDTNIDLSMVSDEQNLFAKTADKCANGFNMLIDKVQNMITQHCPMFGKISEKEIKSTTDGVQGVAPVVNDTTLQAHNKVEYIPGKLQSLLKKDIAETEVIVLDGSDCEDGDWLSKIAITDIRTVSEGAPSFSGNTVENGDVLMNSEGTVCVPVL